MRTSLYIIAVPNILTRLNKIEINGINCMNDDWEKYLDIVMSDLRRLVENTQTHTQNMTRFLKNGLRNLHWKKNQNMNLNSDK